MMIAIASGAYIGGSARLCPMQEAHLCRIGTPGSSSRSSNQPAKPAEVATRLVQALLPDDEVDWATRVEIEYAPKPTNQYLSDNTAFDVFVEYMRPYGQLAFVGIEMKLSEPFSLKLYDTQRYRQLTERQGSPWSPDAWPTVRHIRHNQLWRGHLLVEALLRHSDSPYAAGRLMLMRHPQDFTCAKTVAGYRDLLRPDDDTFIDLPFDRLIMAWRLALSSSDAKHLEWLSQVEQRYLRLEDSKQDWRRHKVLSRVEAPRDDV